MTTYIIFVLYCFFREECSIFHIHSEKIHLKDILPSRSEGVFKQLDQDNSGLTPDVERAAICNAVVVLTWKVKGDEICGTKFTVREKL